MKINGVDDLNELFFQAAKTERKLPRAYDLRAKGCWPAYADDPELAYGYNDAVLTVGGANTQEIGDYDQALDMTQIMDDSDRKLVWAVAHSAARRTRGPAWTKIGKLTGMHAQTVKRRFEQAIMELWYKI